MGVDGGVQQSAGPPAHLPPESDAFALPTDEERDARRRPGQRISRCAPTDREGAVVGHMPSNEPILLDPGLVAEVRARIEDGAR